jgi:hypothetical protein
MSYSFTGSTVQETAKVGVKSDGEVISISNVDGYTVTSTLSSYCAFLSNPVRASTGKWSITLKDPAYKVIMWDVSTILPDGYYLVTQKNTLTTSSAANSLGNLVLNWQFNSAGTPSDFPTNAGTSLAFIISIMYSTTSIA